MAVAVINSVLPGIGVCQEIELRARRRIGIATHRDGQHDLVVFDDDGKAARDSLGLSDEDADAIAEILGAPRAMCQIEELEHQAVGPVVEESPLLADSPFAGRAMGETTARIRTRASVVAIIRGGVVAPSPGPEFALRSGDLLVTVGTAEEVGNVARILAGIDLSRLRWRIAWEATRRSAAASLVPSRFTTSM
jgi:TrkA domain protein